MFAEKKYVFAAALTKTRRGKQPLLLLTHDFFKAVAEAEGSYFSLFSITQKKKKAAKLQNGR